VVDAVIEALNGKKAVISGLDLKKIDSKMIAIRLRADAGYIK